jgi:hypothetical protein
MPIPVIAAIIAIALGMATGLSVKERVSRPVHHVQR